MHQFFICNQDEVAIKLMTLTRTGRSPDGWTDYYVDANSNEKWHLKRYNSENHGGGIPILKRIPEPTIEELIDIAMTSKSTNDIIGASRELLEREKYKKENFRAKLLNCLLEVDTSTLTDFEKERFRIIISESNLHDATNRSDIVGKHFSEVQKEAEYYRISAQKAREILDNIGKKCS